MRYFQHQSAPPPHERLFRQPLPQEGEEGPEQTDGRVSWRLLAGIGDAVAIVLCMGLILGLLTLLFSLVDFVSADLLRSFPVLQSLF